MSLSLAHTEKVLANRVALLTGAASGIGRAQVNLFSAAGASIIAVDRNITGLDSVVAETAADGGDVLGIAADLSNLQSIENAVEKAIDRFGRIDILCNTAGLHDGYVPSLDTSDDLWDQIFEINVKAIFRLTNAVLPGMLARSAGIIVNVASISGSVAGGGGAAYTASKHAVIGYTRQIAYDYGRKGIRANAICPGMVETEMTRDVLAIKESKFVKAVRAVPAGRFAQPEEIAEVALFLASEKAGFMHGAAVMVDGGLTVQ